MKPKENDPLHPLVETLTWRRGLFFIGFIALTSFGASIFAAVLEQNSFSWIDPFLFVLFILLFSQISVGFMIGLIGFFLQLFRGDPLDILQLTLSPSPKTEPLPACAILIPVCNEEMERIARGIRYMWKSIHQTGKGEGFDFYILSDSNQSDAWIQEEAVWLDLTVELHAKQRLFYRKRRRSINKKSGNIADFCRRWGNRYRYMIILDADSIMSGKTMVRLVEAMETSSDIGVIQTVPRIIQGESLFRRVIPFSAQLCGSLFSSGASFWQMNEANYWGHNAIVRMNTFIQYCALPKLPVKDPARRHILSHDTIEAALMIKAGYGVWLTSEETGSYEESPPTLTDMLLRDRRWCKGNLQHIWFLWVKEIHFANRLHIWFGLMSYLASPLWLLFLIFGAINYELKKGPLSITESTANPSSLLLGITLFFLFAPKILGWITQLKHASRYGGIGKLTLSTLLETIFFTLLAPILMIFHSKFVYQAITGLEEKWDRQNRSDAELSWKECFKTYGWVSLLGIFSTALLLYFIPEYSLWFTPVLFSWTFSIAIAKWTSSTSLGKKSLSCGLFQIPETEIRNDELKKISSPPPLLDAQEPYAGFCKAIVDPIPHALHLMLLKEWGQKDRPIPRHILRLIQKVLSDGPRSLDIQQQYTLLWSIRGLRELHQKIWTEKSESVHPDWSTYKSTS